MLLLFAPADDRQRRVLYTLLGTLMFVLILMFLAQGRRPGRPQPEDLDLSFRYDEKERTLTLHLFKSPLLKEAIHDDGPQQPDEVVQKGFGSRTGFLRRTQEERTKDENDTPTRRRQQRSASMLEALLNVLTEQQQG